MTPADMAMRRALDEGARYGNSLPASPVFLVTGYPERNLTSFETSQLPNPSSSPESPAYPHNIHVTRSLSFHKFRQLQHFPVLPSPPALDYKRVRRKQSFAQLAQTPSTSLLPSLKSFSEQSSVPSLLPPLPFTPAPRGHPISPSLSSTVDTVQSTPTRTPLYNDRFIFERWKGSEDFALREPIRTKRKFPAFKPAKRLPHSGQYGGVLGGGQGETWEVHAVVIDSAGDLSASVKASDQAKVGRSEGNSTAFKGRLVRFAGIEEEISSSEHSPLLEKDPSLTSSFSISKFGFPEPPRRTIGLEPETPTSPATLRYEGTYFDVVNPHQSLLLEGREFETPAEIDALLTDYFTNEAADDLSMAGFDEISGEKSDHGNNGSGRQRILYGDAASAYRNITGGYSQPAGSPSGYQSTMTTPALTERATSPEVIVSVDRQQAVIPNFLPRPVAPAPPNTPISSGQEWVAEGYSALATATPPIAAQRGSSLYPHSQRSDPFPLTVSDVESNLGNTNDVAATSQNRSSYFAAGSVAVSELNKFFDTDDLPAENEAAQDTTLGDIVRNYMYDPSPLEVLERDASTMLSSSSAEEGRGYGRRRQSSAGDLAYQPGEHDTSLEFLRAAQTAMGQRSEMPSRMAHPPSAPPPPPTSGVWREMAPVADSDPYNSSNDQSYGNTGQLLGLTPQPLRWPFSEPESPSKLPHSATPTGHGARGSENHDDVWYDIPMSDPGDRSSYANTSAYGSINRLSMPGNRHSVTDELRALEILEGKVAANDTGRIMSPQEEVEQNLNLKELERLRIRNPMAHNRAVKAFADKRAEQTKSILSPPRPAHHPGTYNSLDDIMEQIAHDTLLDAPTSSDRRGLLNPHNSPAPRLPPSLFYSPTANTFMTGPPTPERRIKPHSFLASTQVTPPANALLRSRGPYTASTNTLITNPFATMEDLPATEDIELARLRTRRARNVSRAAMSSQTQLQPLHLVPSTTASCVGGGRRTDAELAADEPGWTMEMDRSHTGAMAQLIGQPDGFGILQADGTVERISLLQRPYEARNMVLIRLQKERTKSYFWWCRLFPITALIFGMGGFDGRIRSITHGGIQEMHPSAKKEALYVWAPLGTILYVAAALTIAMIVVAIER